MTLIHTYENAVVDSTHTYRGSNVYEKNERNKKILSESPYKRVSKTRSTRRVFRCV